MSPVSQGGGIVVHAPATWSRLDPPARLGLAGLAVGLAGGLGPWITMPSLPMYGYQGPGWLIAAAIAFATIALVAKRPRYSVAAAFTLVALTLAVWRLKDGLADSPLGDRAALALGWGLPFAIAGCTTALACIGWAVLRRARRTWALSLPGAVPEGFFAHLAQRLRGTEEGQVFVVGLVLLALFLAELGVILLLDPAAGWALAKAIPIDMFSGKEAALPVALAGGAPWWLAAQTSALQHLALGTLAFPVFLFLLHRYRDRDNLLMRRLRRIETAANRHRTFVTRWGPLGVFLFMMVPFLVNGPLVGGILGRISGIASRYLALPVIAATVLSSFLWAGGYHRILSIAEGVDPRLPAFMAAGIIALALGFALLDEYQERKKERAAAAIARHASQAGHTEAGPIPAPTPADPGVPRHAGETKPGEPRA